jgi:hypothetical protein
LAAALQEDLAFDMPTTVAQGFAWLRETMEVTTLQESTVSIRQNRVRGALERGMEVIDSCVVGSYRRCTMVAPLNACDVDICVVLDPKHYNPDRPAGLLDKVRSILLNTYTQSPRISRSGQAVTVTFADFKVDVVPAFNRQGGGYVIPNSNTGGWIETDPKKHIQIWSAANKANNGNLIPLIKMVKTWNRTHSALFRSFHLELLVLHALNGVTISDFPSGVRFVFDKARELVRYTIPDPAGFGDNVGGYLNTPQKLQDVIDHLDTAYERASLAEQLAADGNISAAYQKWGILFRGYFPIYR